MLIEALYSEAMAFLQVVFIDLVLAGDNAIVVAMAASGVAPEHRRKVIVSGIGAAVVLRILFAALTVQLMEVIGLLLAGGILLLWVCWKLWRELREQGAEDKAAEELASEILEEDGETAVQQPCKAPRAAAAPSEKTVRQAILQVAVADVSMSLDNVLAVAGAAHEHISALVFGLALSVVLMGIGAALIARLLQRYHWLGYLGLVLIFYVAGVMIYRGGMEIYRFANI